MKKLIYLINLLLLLTGNLYSQKGNDTLINNWIDSTYYNRAVKCQKLQKNDDPFVIATGINGKGYITGTQGSTLQNGKQVTVSEVALAFTLSDKILDPQNTKLYLTRLSFPKLPQNETARLFLHRIVSDPDEFMVKLYRGQPGGAPNGKPFFTKSFNLDDLLLNNLDIDFENEVEIPEEFFISIQINSKDQDDTLAFFTSNFQRACGLGERLTYLLFTDIETFETVNTWNALSKISNPPIDADIILFPHFKTSTIVSRNEDMDSAQLVLIPNPAQNAFQIKDKNNFVSYSKVEIIDMLGKIYVPEFNSNTNTYLIENLNSGLYSVKIIKGTKFIHKKLYIFN